MRPERIELPINRSALYQYKRRESRLTLCLLGAGVLMFFTLMATVPSKNDTTPYASMEAMIRTIVTSVGIAGIVGVILGYILNHLLYARHAKKFADNYGVAIDGPFLHITERGQAKIDRKIHFKNLDDYCIRETSLMTRSGMSSIVISHLVGLNSNQPTRRIELLAVQDTEKMRDLLVTVDAERE